MWFSYVNVHCCRVLCICRCNKLLQRAAIMLMQRPRIFSTLALDLLVNSQLSGLCVKNYQWMCNLGCAWCNKLMQRTVIINAAPWNFVLGWLPGIDFDLIRLWNHLDTISKIYHATITYCSADALAGFLTGWWVIRCGLVSSSLNQVLIKEKSTLN